MFELHHTPYIEKQIAKLVVASFATNTMFRTNYKCVGPQHGPTIHKHVKQGLHVVLGNVLLVFIHFFTLITWN